LIKSRKQPSKYCNQVFVLILLSLAFILVVTISDDMFDFEDIRMDASAGLGMALPSPHPSAAIGPPPGILFESLPSSVASEVMGGGEVNKFVCCWLVHSVEDVCGGEIKGGETVIRSCSKPRDMCSNVASQAKCKAIIMPSCLYPRVPKKGSNQVGLEPALPLSPLPLDEMLDMLLLEEKPIAIY
jgi:hypothetical protein